jgi:hypothetical protein
MRDKNDSYISEDNCQDGAEWHLEFGYTPDFPYPFPIVLAGARDKHDAVGHLSADGRVHVFNAGIIEQLVRAGLRARVSGNGTKSDAGNGGQKPESSK